MQTGGLYVFAYGPKMAGLLASHASTYQALSGAGTASQHDGLLADLMGSSAFVGSHPILDGADARDPAGVEVSVDATEWNAPQGSTGEPQIDIEAWGGRKTADQVLSDITLKFVYRTGSGNTEEYTVDGPCPMPQLQICDTFESDDTFELAVPPPPPACVHLHHSRTHTHR